MTCGKQSLVAPLFRSRGLPPRERHENLQSCELFRSMQVMSSPEPKLPKPRFKGRRNNECAELSMRITQFYFRENPENIKILSRQCGRRGAK